MSSPQTERATVGGTRTLVFTDRDSSELAALVLERLRRQLAVCTRLAAPPHAQIRSLLIDAGILESAAADALCPARDEPLAPLRRLRATTDALGRALALSWRHALPDQVRRHLADAAACADIDPSCLPRRLRLRTPEGYAFYALYPEAYADAATAWARASRPPHVVCIGLRSIGTSLASAVQGALAIDSVPVTTWTIRPRGHPFDRHAAVSHDLIAEWAAAGGAFLLVDEGPGLSGSSLAAAAELLDAHGIERSRIVLLPAHAPHDPDTLRSERARARFREHTILTPSSSGTLERLLAPAGVGRASDLSGGRWRSLMLAADPPDTWPAVCPWFERLKFLTPDGSLLKFAGLGAAAARAHARAERLAQAGWSPRAHAPVDGFLALDLAPGRPLAPAPVDDTVLTRAGEYVAWLRRHESMGDATVEPLAEMLALNAHEGLAHDDVDRGVERLIAGARRFTEPAAAIDGRMAPHEWVRDETRILKTDALDHHCDHFLPGPADTAWDIAGLIVEAALDAPAREAAMTAYRPASGDRTIEARLPFYLAAYSAFRLGYCVLVSNNVDAIERARFARARARYAAALCAAAGVRLSAVLAVD